MERIKVSDAVRLMGVSEQPSWIAARAASNRAGREALRQMDLLHQSETV